MSLPIHLRAADSGDLSLIFSSWLRTFARSFEVADIAPKVYYARKHTQIERLIARGAVLVACNPDDHVQVYGWACTEGGAVHYVCVKPTYQRLGVARRLVAPYVDSNALYTHRTAICRALPIPKQWVYDPFAKE